MAKKVKRSDFTKCDTCGIEIKKVNELSHKFKNHPTTLQKKAEEDAFNDLPDVEIRSDFKVDEFLGKTEETNDKDDKD